MMHNRCNCGDASASSTMLHAFVDLNGLPYLLGEFIDRRELMRIDRSAIQSGITVDCSDAMRAVVDISISDIDVSDRGTLAIVGNRIKTRRLLEMISKHAKRMEGNLPVLKSGIIVRINYQLEVQGTGRVIRSMVEDVHINDRQYFLDMSQTDVDDNAIIVNFNNSSVSTINEFTHGTNPMALRITNVQLFYELVGDRQPIPRIKQSMTAHPYDCPDSHILPGSNEEYLYHREAQNQMYLGDMPGQFNERLYPPQWAMFNQFYHFDQDGTRIVLHGNEIYDPLRKTSLLPCGAVRVNRQFMINPGHRLIFKFSIWKNDVTGISNTLKVASALKAKFYNCCNDNHHNDHCDHECNCNRDHSEHHHEHDHHDKEYRQLVNMLYDERKKNELNGRTINDLLTKIDELEAKLAAVETPGGDDTDEPPVVPVDPDNPDESDKCDGDHSEILDRIDNLEQKVTDEDIDPMPEAVVEQIYRDVTSTNKEGE